MEPIVLLPTPSYYPAQTGGPDNTCYWLTKSLTKNGVKTVISSTDFGLPQDVTRNEWLETDYGKILFTRNPIHYMPLRTIWNAIKQLRNTNVLHLTMITYPASWLTAIVNAYTYRLPVVWSSHGDLDPYMLKRSPKKKRFVIWLIKNIIGTKNICFHSTCDAETQYQKDVFGDDIKIVQITNYMDIPEQVFEPRQKDILFLGRIDKKKGIENLFQAARESELFMQSEFRIIVAGDYSSPYGNELVRLKEELGLADKVEFIGHRAGEEKERLLAAAHFLIMPSHTENFGIVVTEALAQGTPAVASTGTPWAVLEEYEAGFWVDNDPASLVRVLEKMINMPTDKYARYSKNSLRLVKEEFSMDENVDKWIRLYRAMVNGNLSTLPELVNA